MPRKLAEFKRTVARIQALKSKGQMSPQQATRLLERARLAYQAYVIRFEQQPQSARR